MEILTKSDLKKAADNLKRRMFNDKFDIRREKQKMIFVQNPDYIEDLTQLKNKDEE